MDRQAKLRLAGLAFLIVLQTLMEVVSVGLVLPFIAMVNDPRLIDSSKVFGEARYYLGVDTATGFLAIFGLALFVLIFVKNVFYYSVMRLQARFGCSQAAIVSSKLVERYLAAPFEYHLRHNSGDMITTADRFVDHVFAQVVIVAMLLVTEAAAVLGIIAFMLAIEPTLTLLLGAVLGGCSVALMYLMRARLTALGHDQVRLHRSRLQTLQQALASIKDVKVMGSEGFFLSKYRKLRYEHAAVEAASQSLHQLPRPILEIVVTGGIVLVVLIILLQNRAASEMMGILGLFAMGAFRILPGANRIVYAYSAIKNNGPAVDRVAKDFFSAEMRDRLPGKTEAELIFAREIKFDNVSFAYSGAAGDALKIVALSIRRGEAIGLVGSSGAGKSTLVDVLLGLLTPQSGKVLVDGRDITTDPRQWRKVIGYVPQSISLIDDTLRNNIAFGIDANRIDDAQIWRSLELAHLDEFIRADAKGLDMMIGERGVRLSGGQRQRIGVARALYRNPEVLVLDEATSALDNESERQVTEAIESLHGEKTLIVIAHRLSTVERCDRIVLLRDGAIVDDGPFKELLERNADFYEMVRLATLTNSMDAARLPQLAIHE